MAFLFNSGITNEVVPEESRDQDIGRDKGIKNDDIESSEE